MVGFDTGFFVRLLERHPAATAAWEPVQAGETAGLLSCLTLYELRRLGLKGAIPLPVADGLLAQLPQVCRVVWLTSETLDHAARVAHGTRLSMADALILVSLMDAGARVVYTTDADLARYPGGPEIRRL